MRRSFFKNLAQGLGIFIASILPLSNVAFATDEYRFIVNESVETSNLNFDSNNSANGHITFIHPRYDEFRYFTAALKNVGHNQGELMVQGVSSKISRVKLESSFGGRKVLTLYFEKVANLGESFSGIMTGTLMDDGKTQVYFGDIYIHNHSDDHDHHHHEHCKTLEDPRKSVNDLIHHHHWSHKGGFMFSRNL